MGKTLDQRRLLVERDQEELVVGVSSLEEAHDRVPRGVDVVLHAAADVEQDADRYRGGLLDEVGDLLFHLVFEDPEVVLLEAGYVAVERVRDRDLDEDRIDLGAERGAFLALLAGSLA